MPRNIVVPHIKNKLFEVDNWAVFRRPPTASSSPLWVCLKVINLAALRKRHRRGTFRAYWLFWGIDARRFRFSKYQRDFESAEPTVYAATVRWLQDVFGPAELERIRSRLGDLALAAERERLSQSRLLHEEHDRRRAAEAAALEALF